MVISLNVPTIISLQLSDSNPYDIVRKLFLLTNRTKDDKIETQERKNKNEQVEQYHAS